MRCFASGLVAVGALAACANAGSAQSCPESAAAGSLRLTRSDVVDAGAAEHDYALSSAQVEELVKKGSLTVTAGQDGVGAGPLEAGDPVIALTMRPVPDAPGTYAVQDAQAVFCPSASAKLVVSNGAVSGCAPAGDVLTVPLHVSVTVTSASSKKIETGVHPGGGWDAVYIAGGYGAACP